MEADTNKFATALRDLDIRHQNRRYGMSLPDNPAKRSLTQAFVAEVVKLGM